MLRGWRPRRLPSPTQIGPARSEHLGIEVGQARLRAGEGQGGGKAVAAASFPPLHLSPTRGERARSSGFGLRPLLVTGLLTACLLAPAAPIALKLAVGRVELPSLQPETGKLVLDRNGVLLRPFATSDGR